MRRAFETLRVNLVDIFCTGRTGGEPAVGRADFQTADGGVVAGRARELLRDGIAGKSAGRDGFRREFLEGLLLLGRRGRINAGVAWGTKFCRQLGIMLV